MTIILNQTSGELRLAGLQPLQPGRNEVADSDWARVRQQPNVLACLMRGKLCVVLNTGLPTLDELRNETRLVGSEQDDADHYARRQEQIASTEDDEVQSLDELRAIIADSIDFTVPDTLNGMLARDAVAMVRDVQDWGVRNAREADALWLVNHWTEQGDLRKSVKEVLRVAELELT